MSSAVTQSCSYTIHSSTNSIAVQNYRSSVELWKSKTKAKTSRRLHNANTSCPRFDPKLIHIHISVHRPWSSISSISCRWESVGWWFRPSVSPCLSLHVFACLCFSLSLSLSLCAWAHHCGLLCLVLLMKWTYSLIKTFNIILAIAESASD